MNKALWALLSTACLVTGCADKKADEAEATRSAAKTTSHIKEQLARPARTRIVLSTADYELIEATFKVKFLSSSVGERTCMIWRDKELKTSTVTCRPDDLDGGE